MIALDINSIKCWERGILTINKHKKNNNISSSTPDSVIIQEIALSNPYAFRLLFLRYYNMIYNYFFSRIYSKDLAKDLVQEVFLRLWQTRKKLDPEKPIKVYLYHLAHNILIDNRRKKKFEDANFGDIINCNREHLIDLKIDIKTAIENLPEKIRTVYQLNRYEGFTYTEIAKICQISVKTVEYRISKALKILHKILD